MSLGGRGRPSSHASSDPILNNRDVFRSKATTRITDKKSLVSRMRRLFEPKPRKPAGGELPEGLQGFFEPVLARSVKPPSGPVEILSDDSEYNNKPPTTEREWNYLMTEPIFNKKGYLQPPLAYRRHNDIAAAATATDPSNHQQTPRSVNNYLGVSNFKKKFEESFERSTQAGGGTAEGM